MARHAWQEKQLGQRKRGARGHLGGQNKGRFVFDKDGIWEHKGVQYPGNWTVVKTTEGKEPIEDDCPCWQHTSKARKVPKSKGPAAGGS